jgi:dTDP-L-rhamnose 4-epimerase
VYGPRQALSNPYTGVGAIFGARLLNGRPPVIFEDGLQSRDFVHVTDIARANIFALESDGAKNQVFNIGTGEATSILEIARMMARHLNVPVAPLVVGQYRAGDIRHCYADISKASAMIGFQPQITLENGMRELIEWVSQQSAIDRVDLAREELAKRGLTH